MAPYVLAVDPGKTTGWTTWYEVVGVGDGGQLQFQEFCTRAEDWIRRVRNDGVVVAERFIINQQTVKNSQAPWSMYVIGVLMYLTRKYTGRELVLQSPSDAKNFMPDARLKLLGWHTRGQVHQNDAARHLGLWLAQNRLLEPPVIG